MTRLAAILALFPALAIASGWSPEFSGGLTNATPDRRFLSNLFWAVNERCEATYLGFEVVTNEAGVATNRVYGVAPLVVTQSVVRWDYTNLIVCGLVTQTWSGGSAILTNWCPSATTNTLTNQLAYASLDVLREIGEAALALPPYYLDTSRCPSGDCSGWFSTPTNADVPRWSAVDYIEALGVGQVVTSSPVGERIAALSVMPPRTTAVLLAEAFTVPDWVVITSTVPTVTGRYDYVSPARYDGPMVLWSCDRSVQRWWTISSSGETCDLFAAEWWGGSAWGPQQSAPYLTQDGTASAWVVEWATNELRLDWLDRGTYPPRYIASTNTPTVRVMVTTGACPSVTVRIEGERITWSGGYMSTTAAVETVIVLASLTTSSVASCSLQWGDITNMVIEGVYDARMDSLVVQYEAEIGYGGQLSGEPLYGVLWELYRIIDGLRYTAPPTSDWPTRIQTVGWLQRVASGYGISAEFVTDNYADFLAQQARPWRYETPATLTASGVEVVQVGVGAEAAAGRLEEVGQTSVDAVRWGLADWSELRLGDLTPYVMVGTGTVESVGWWAQTPLVDESDCGTSAPPRLVALQQSATSSVQSIAHTGSYYRAEGAAVVGASWSPYSGILAALLDGCPTNQWFDLRGSVDGIIPGMARPDLAPDYSVYGLYYGRRVTGQSFATPSAVVRWGFEYRD